MTMTHAELLSKQSAGILHFGGARMVLLDVEAGFWALRRQLEALAGSRLADIVLAQAGANGGASFARSFVGPASRGLRALRDCIAAYEAAGFGRFEIAQVEWPLGRVMIRAHDTFEAWMVRQHGAAGATTVCAYTTGVLVGFVNVLTGRHDIVCVERACQGQDADHCLFELLPAHAAGDAPVVAMDPDPGLGKQLGLLEMLFERMPMGIAIFDPDLRIRRYNPTWAGFAELHAAPSAVAVAPGAYYFDLLPGTEPTVMPLFERALANETVRLDAVRLESEGVVTHWDVVLAPIAEGGEVTGILNVTVDATDRVEAHQELERTLTTLREREERLALVMEGINDGVWDWNVESGDVYFSPRWKSMLGYDEGEIPNRFESWEGLVHPGDRQHARDTIDGHLAGDTPSYELEHRLRHKNGEYRWILTRGKALRRKDGSVYRVVGSHTDITERVEAQRHLEQRVAERTHELSTLLEVSHHINATLELDSLLERILNQLKAMVDYTGASILTLDDGRLAVRAYRGPIPQAQALALRFSLDEAPVNREVINLRAPVRIPDVREDTSMARLFRLGAGDALDTVFGYVRSWLGVPLIVKDEVIGMLTLDHGEIGFFSEQHAHLVSALANQVAVAIENARLYYAEQEQLEESERRRRVAEGLRDILDVLNSDRSLAEVLDFIVGQARDLLGAEATLIRQVDFREEMVTAVASCNLPADLHAGATTRLYYSERDRTLMARQPLLRPDLLAEDPPGGIEARLVDDAMHAWIAAEHKHYRSLLAAPIFRQEEVYGSLRFYFGEPRPFSDEDVQLAMMLADHAALAIENARLRTQAREAAVAAERNRLARDLHDAVTQTLFSSSLIAEVLPAIWAKDQEEGERRITELRELTRGALAEMRTLLLELRPAALVEARLSDLMRQLAQSVTGRARVPINLEVEGECELTPEVNVALYRIAQEALNNVAKHARAGQVTVRLHCRPGGAELYVCDDGIGFDPATIRIDSLGVGIMRERAEAIGAALEIDSHPGEGTEVCVRWPANKEEKGPCPC